jgi:hypothetical protein
MSSDAERKIVTDRLFQCRRREEPIRTRPKLPHADFFWEGFVLTQEKPVVPRRDTIGFGSCSFACFSISLSVWLSQLLWLFLAPIVITPFLASSAPFRRNQPSDGGINLMTPVATL